jgi:hypothetical protein
MTRLSCPFLSPHWRKRIEIMAAIVTVTDNNDCVPGMSLLSDCFWWWRVAVLPQLKGNFIQKRQFGNSGTSHRRKLVSEGLIQCPGHCQVSWPSFEWSRHSEWVWFTVVYEPCPAWWLEVRCPNVTGSWQSKGRFDSSHSLAFHPNSWTLVIRLLFTKLVPQTLGYKEKGMPPQGLTIEMNLAWASVRKLKAQLLF